MNCDGNEEIGTEMLSSGIAMWSLVKLRQCATEYCLGIVRKRREQYWKRNERHCIG